MIHRDGDQVTITISMQEYQTLLIALGYGLGSAMSTTNNDLMTLFKNLLGSVTEIKHGAE